MKVPEPDFTDKFDSSVEILIIAFVFTFIYFVFLVWGFSTIFALVISLIVIWYAFQYYQGKN